MNPSDLTVVEVLLFEDWAKTKSIGEEGQCFGYNLQKLEHGIKVKSGSESYYLSTDSEEA